MEFLWKRKSLVTKEFCVSGVKERTQILTGLGRNWRGQSHATLSRNVSVLARAAGGFSKNFI